MRTRPATYFIKKYWLWICAGLLIIRVSIIPVRLYIAAQQAPLPQAIFVLGGGHYREESAAQLAWAYPSLDVWISSGSTPETIYSIFQKARVSTNRLHLDYQASDTIGNFTTLLSDLKAHHLQHLWLVTSDYHMSRASAIAFIILGDRGITYTPHIVPSTNRPPESALRINRDVLRSLLWITTGQTGEVIGRKLGLENEPHP